MAWIYLAELEDSQLASGIGLDQSRTVKKTDTHKGSFSAILAEELYPTPPSGMTYARLKEITLAQLTSSTAVSPARTSAALAMESAWKASEADFIGNCTAWSAKSRPNGFSSKTSQPLELEDFSPLFDHLPISGMIVDGLVYQPQKLVPRTLGKGGSCLPTPTAMTYGSNQGGAAGRTGKIRMSLNQMARKNIWPTPVARDWKSEKYKEGNFSKRKTKSLPAIVGGKLNPMWVEWLMGYPSGWTELRDWATQWFRCKQR